MRKEGKLRSDGKEGTRRTEEERKKERKVRENKE